MNYPDDFKELPGEGGRCVQCGHYDYTDDEGICDDCRFSLAQLDGKLKGKSPSEQVEVLLNR